MHAKIFFELITIQNYSEKTSFYLSLINLLIYTFYSKELFKPQLWRQEQLVHPIWCIQQAFQMMGKLLVCG